MRFEGGGEEGLIDYRLHQASHRRAPVDEVIALTTLNTTRYSGWNTRQLTKPIWQQTGGKRSYTWVKSVLQKEGAVKAKASTASSAALPVGQGSPYQSC